MGASEKFFKGISVQTIITALNAILQLVVFAILSRVLTKEQFGFYAALMGVTLIFMCITDAGVGAAVIQRKDMTDRYASTAFSMSVIIGVAISILFLIISPVVATLVLDETLITAMMLMSIPLFLHSVNGYAVGCLRRELRFATIGISKLFSYTIAAAVAIYMALCGMGEKSLVALFILDTLFYTIFLYLKISIPRFSLYREESKSVVSFSGWLMLGVIMSSITNQIDKLLLGRWLSVEKLGAYNRPAGFITNIISQINTVFDGVLFPILSVYQDSMVKFRELLYRSYGLLSTLGVLLATFLYFNSDLIIWCFFGREWNSLIPVLKISSLSAVFMLNNTLADCFFRSFNLVKSGFFIRAFGLMVALLFLYIGVKYDLVGVALSFFTANLFVVILKILYLSYRSQASLLRFLYISIRGWIPAVPVIIVGMGCEYLFNISGEYVMSGTVTPMFVKLTFISIALIVELLFFPHFVGEEYSNLIYDKITIFRKKSST